MIDYQVKNVQFKGFLKVFQSVKLKNKRIVIKTRPKDRQTDRQMLIRANQRHWGCKVDREAPTNKDVNGFPITR